VATPSQPVGETVSHYRILSKIGGGAMAWLAGGGRLKVSQLVVEVCRKFEEINRHYHEMFHDAGRYRQHREDRSQSELFAQLGKSSVITISIGDIPEIQEPTI
jgi:hypothetical protein